jgi:hypothetical protein
MSSFEWNKIIASVLTAMIVAMVAGILASSMVRPKHLEKAAYLPPGAEGEAGASTAAALTGNAAATETDRAAAMSPAHGQQLAKECAAVPRLRRAAPAVGPDLFGALKISPACQAIRFLGALA